MALAPIALISPQYEEYPNWWIKFYVQDTSTPIAMATDSTGGTLLARAEISAGGTVPIGFIKTAGDAIFIPWVDGDYDLWLFPTAAEADANDTANAIQLADDINADPAGLLITASDNRYAAVFGSVSSMLTLTTIDGLSFTPASGQLVKLASYRTSIPYTDPQGGGGDLRVMTLAEYALTPDEVGAAFTVGGFAFVRVNIDPNVIDAMQWGVVSNSSADISSVTATDSSASFDAILSYCWDNVELKRYDIMIPDNTLLTKAGDFDIPPNVHICGSNGKSRLYLGDSLTRMYHMRNNGAISTGAATTNQYYWSLGFNLWQEIEIKSYNSIVVANAMYVSNLIRFTTKDLQIEDDNITVGIHLENNADPDSGAMLWTEFWDIDGSFMCGTDCIKFTNNGGTSSFGHGRLGANLTVNSGQNGLNITDNASPYHMLLKTKGFVQTATAATEAALVRCSNGGKLNYCQVESTIESLQSNGNNYAFINEGTGGSEISFGAGVFNCVSTTVEFKGVNVANDFKIVGGELYYLDGVTQAFQGNQILKSVTGTIDAAGRNYLYPHNGKTLQINIPGTLTANQIVGYLPRNVDRQHILTIQIIAGTASTGNTSTDWVFGIRKEGSTTPTVEAVIADGATDSFNELYYQVPTGWYALNKNEIICRDIAGTGNDGTGPSDVTLLISYIE